MGLVFQIFPKGISELKSVHEPGKRDLTSFNENMNVVGHQGIGVDGTMELVFILGEQLPIKRKISIVAKDSLALVSAGNYMVQRT